MTYSNMCYSSIKDLNNSKTGGTYTQGVSLWSIIEKNIYWFLSIFLLLCLFGGTIQQWQDKSIQAKISADMSKVYSVCNESRISATISEQKCGELQDQTHTEFLCNANNNLSSNHCWVEYKGVNYEQ